MQARTPTFRETLFAALGLLALAALFCGPNLLWHWDEAPYDHGDSVASYLPYWVRSYYPLSPEIAGAWDPTLWTGLPESHTPFGRYYPVTCLLFALFPLGLALSLTFPIHHALAALGTYVLLRTAGFRRASAVLGALVFGFSSFLVFHRVFVMMFQTAAWLPWILWAFEKFRRERRGIWIVLAGSLIAVHALAAHSQIIVIGGMTWVLYAVYFMILGEGSLAARLRFGAGIGLACLLGAVGSLPQTLPMMEVGSWTPYVTPDWDFYRGGSFKAHFIVALAGAWAVGHNFEAGCFFGLVPLALLIIGLGAAWRLLRVQSPDPAIAPDRDEPRERAWPRREVGWWITLGAFHLLLMLGRNSPLYLALFGLPVYNMFHIPGRHLWVVCLSVAWISALGLERVVAAPAGERLRLWRQAALGLVLLGGTCAAILYLRKGVVETAVPRSSDLWMSLVWGIAALAGLAVVLRSKQARAVRLVGLLVLTFVELRVAMGSFSFAPMSTDRASSATHFPAFARELRAAGNEGVPVRCFMEPGCWQSRVPQGEAPNAWGQIWGLSVLNCYSQSMPRSLAELVHLDNYGLTQFNRVLWEERGLSALGGRFIVPKRAPRPAAPDGFLQVGREDIWPKSPPLLFTCQPGQPSQLRTSVLLESVHPYLLEGELLGKGALQGDFRIHLEDFGQTVADVVLRREDFVNDRCAFAFLLSPLVTRFPRSVVEMRIECTGTMAVELSAFNFWSLRERPTDESVGRARALAVKLRATAQSPYVLHATTDPPIYENPRARGLATLVREVRAARDDLTAARGILEARDRPVRELAFVVAPPGELTVSGPRFFAPGTAEVTEYRPDDIDLCTRSRGEAFLVLTVTRCRGWTATIDGEEVPIHAVDGPLMGVRVPAGEHMVRFQFRPVLVQLGATAAGSIFVLAWGSVLASAWRRRRVKAHAERQAFAAPQKVAA